MPLVTVQSAQPTQVASSYATQFLVKNAGPNTVYLSQYPSVTATDYDTSVPAGASLNWSGKSDLWGVCATGQTTVLEILYQGNTAFVPAAPTSSETSSVAVISNLAFKTLLPVQQISPGSHSYTSPVIDVSGIAYLMVVFGSNDTEPGGLQVTAGTANWPVYLQDATNNFYANKKCVGYMYFSQNVWIVTPQSNSVKLFMSFPIVATSNMYVTVVGTDKTYTEGFYAEGPINGGYGMYGLTWTNIVTPGHIHIDFPNIPAGDLIRIPLPVGSGEFVIEDETITQAAAGTVSRQFVTLASSATPQPYLVRNDTITAPGTVKFNDVKLRLGCNTLYLEILGTGTNLSYAGNFYVNSYGF